MSFNHHTVRLGKKPVRHDPRTLCVAKYVKSLPPPPPSVDWSKPVSFPCGFFLNDQLGDCTCAGPAHAVQVVTANASPPEVTVADADVLAMYEGSCGYVPGNPATDQGGDELTVLGYWRKHGIGTSGHKIDAFAAVNVLNSQEVMQGLDLFGFLYIGILLPVSAQAQVGGVWDVDPTSAGSPGSWGGHCVIIVQADPNGLTCITWGALQRMTWAFWNRYVDEAYVVLTPEWISADSRAPSGFDLATLQSDLAAITA
jgi:hypothetical protein